MGVFQKVKGSNEWWIRYADQYGHIHREKAGPKGLAQKAYEKRKTQIREGKFFPEAVGKRKDILFKDMARLYLESKVKSTRRKRREGRSSSTSWPWACPSSRKACQHSVRRSPASAAVHAPISSA